MNPLYEIRQISSSETWPLRKKVLRPGTDFKNYSNPQDDLHLSFHLGAFHQTNLIGIASFHEELFAQLPAQFPFRLRGMATDPDYQRKAVGKTLLEESFRLLSQKNCDLLWCNAREVAFLFYQRLGLQTVEPLFDIPGVGPHKVMYKYLS